jgi:UDP-N-acetylglucosamine--N-acetylmuramyl-(pentapeptide) pyrophosphoryl-undecaprenol N-acetylglucosamine transferase
MAGGGTGGHIMPNIAIIDDLKASFPPSRGELGILYFGGRSGMEAALLEPLGVEYRGIFCGKLRRYFSWQNFIDVFKTPIGFFQAFFALVRFRPQAVFCKGGYVSFPVAVAGWMARIPVILHESDVIPGLANRLSARFSRIICVSFEESRKYFPSKKVLVTGNPVRREIVRGNKEDGKTFTGLKENLPTILVIGGSQGANVINKAIFAALNELLEKYQIVHICGKDNLKGDEEISGFLGSDSGKFAHRYRAFDFVGAELKHLYALSDLIVSRAGANSLAEIAMLGKPSVLIPLGTKASRGDQIVNAEVFSKSHASVVIGEDELTAENLAAAIAKLMPVKADSRDGHDAGGRFVANEKIVELLLNLTK